MLGYYMVWYCSGGWWVGLSRDSQDGTLGYYEALRNGSWDITGTVERVGLVGGFGYLGMIDVYHSWTI